MLAVGNRAWVSPALEDSPDGQIQLFAGVGGEIASRLLLHDLLELRYQFLPILRGKIDVQFHAALLFLGGERLLEIVAIDVHDDAGEHLDEAAVGIVGETLVSGLGRQAVHRLIVQA